MSGPTLPDIATHYEVLGVAPDAPPERIRAAYHDRARRHHPDHVGAGPQPGLMAAVNEAYRVLSDPARRLSYDRTLRPGAAITTRWTAGARADDIDPPITSTPVPPSRLMPSGPARVPWKLMAVAAAVGSAIVVFAAAFNDPPSEEVPDGILRTGSCVEVEANSDVREVACTGTDDVVVDLVLPTDATCPADMGTYRDRLGLGKVCIEFD